MYVVTNRVSVKSEYQDEFEQRFRSRVGQIERNPGFVRMSIMRPATEGAPYLVQTWWQTREDFEAWVGSADFKAAHANPMPREAFSGPPQMERHELVIDAPAD